MKITAQETFVVGTDWCNLTIARLNRDDFSRAGEVMSSGITAFETACWDIVGKALDEPVHTCINGWHHVEREPDEVHVAALHLAACTTKFRIPEYSNDFADPWIRETAEGLPERVDCFFALPQRPGLGLELNEVVIEAHPERGVDVNLSAEGWEKPATIRTPGERSDG